jgi:hypothetical protein
MVEAMMYHRTPRRTIFRYGVTGRSLAIQIILLGLAWAVATFFHLTPWFQWLLLIAQLSLVSVLGIGTIWFAVSQYLMHRVRRFRIANGLCLQCGYDIRSNIDRCPECGAMVPRHREHF